MDWNVFFNTIVSWATTVGVKLLIALIVMFISFKIINFAARKIEIL